MDIVRADIVTNRGQSRGMATVEFSNKQNVRDAISKYDHFEYRGREIFVRQDYPPPGDKKRDFQSSSNSSYPQHSQSRPTYDNRFEKKTRERGGYERDNRYSSSASSTSTSHNNSLAQGSEIFVGNLPFSINWQALKDLMRKAGEVVRADVRMDNWGKSRGFGTVVFATEEAANKAVEEFQGYEIEGRKLDTRPGRSHNSATSSHSSERKPLQPKNDGPFGKNNSFTHGVTEDGEISNTIYVKNLPFVTNVDDLYELFETIGRVTEAGIQYTESDKPSGNAVIQFELEELADLAIKNLDNYNYGGRDLSITYAKRPEQADSTPIENDINRDFENDESVTKDVEIDDIPEAEAESQAEAEAEPTNDKVDDDVEVVDGEETI